ncbi:MAG: hypothetical protein AAGB93_21905 [Planctomycetota bacterium]
MTSLVAFGLAAVLTSLLAAVALRVGWIDRREGLEDRKPRQAPVPLVGGAAILAALLLTAWWTGDGRLAGTALAWPALCAAFLLGLVDDVVPGGLRASAKLAGQLAVGVLVVLWPGIAWEGATVGEHLTLGLLAVVAMNAVNTFDHQDGAAGALGVLALGPVAPPLGAAVAGYLPLNTVIRRPDGQGGTVPLAMLGDAGSHLLGVAIATMPGAAVLLVVPLLDLARVAAGRIERGRPFWLGDRTHLGHRLGRLGFGPVPVALLLGTILAPPVVARILVDGRLALGAGLALSGILFCLAIAVTESGEGVAEGAPGLGSSTPGTGPHAAGPFAGASGSDDAPEGPR